MATPRRIETDRPAKAAVDHPPIFRVRGLNVHYGTNHALKDITVEVPERQVTAFIGPSGCGKSTFLRCLNRMNDLIPGAKTTGQILLQDQDINASNVSPAALRRHVGMVFQKPNPFPKSIFENVAYGLRLEGGMGKEETRARVEEALRQANLWDEVKDRLDTPGTSLSGGQQQRLCIARALAIRPNVLLMDEPTSALDPIATARIEDLVAELRERYTVVIVTHNMQQAARISDHTAFFYIGELVEFGETKQIFENPRDPRTEAYVTGRFG